MAHGIVNNSFFINRLKKGENTAYETLFRLYFDRLFYFAKSYLEDEDEAKEITQNVFFKFWKKRASLNIDSNLNAYLFRMTKNECLDYFKHQKVKANYHDVIQRERASLNQTSLQDHPDLLLIESELEEKVNQILNELPPRCKQIFIKSRFEGLKYKEISSEMNISIKTVEHQIAKALRLFRRELQEYMGLF
ncbi:MULTISPECIES: RNA polymerase sigma-70 factor [Salegentibacter]|uniref:RNA polymerase sigma-70 factor, ECF subfamily n=1 Tax=Salegentibacter agarivorans TaxID=345907 RepID=A0A1I2NKT5_9FLAO|nr:MULTISPECIES: RNA polymerase sigma-70 factor [Salegentibacter]SFG04615.1 RNA polymerase sigma-70 factor, ECF subfamily [Salegentibacter agarivorans]